MQVNILVQDLLHDNELLFIISSLELKEGGGKRACMSPCCRGCGVCRFGRFPLDFPVGQTQITTPEAPC